MRINRGTYANGRLERAQADERARKMDLPGGGGHRVMPRGANVTGDGLLTHTIFYPHPTVMHKANAESSSHPVGAPCEAAVGCYTRAASGAITPCIACA